MMRARRLTTAMAAAALCATAAFCAPPALAQEKAFPPAHHFAVNGNFDSTGRFAPRAYGFDIADVAGAEALDGLPAGVLGMVWVGSCNGDDTRFRALVNSTIDRPNLFGFYLMDDPDPQGRWRQRCRPEDLRAEADFIHARRAEARTFVALMNVGDARTPAFDPALGPDSTHVDLFGIAPYPCRRDWRDCDYAMIGRFVGAARRIGIGDKAIVPVYQTFGGGDWQAEGGGYRLPTEIELRRMLEVWRETIPAPVFDYAYSWGSQKSDFSLASSGALREVFRRRNEQ
jgi:hypothetical protein